MLTSAMYIVGYQVEHGEGHRYVHPWDPRVFVI